MDNVKPIENSNPVKNMAVATRDTIRHVGLAALMVWALDRQQTFTKVVKFGVIPVAVAAPGLFGARMQKDPFYGLYEALAELVKGVDPKLANQLKKMPEYVDAGQAHVNSVNGETIGGSIRGTAWRMAGIGILIGLGNCSSKLSTFFVGVNAFFLPAALLKTWVPAVRWSLPEKQQQQV